jgi:hypothetical protein
MRFLTAFQLELLAAKVAKNAAKVAKRILRAGRNPFHGPGLNNMDIVFAKDTRITESTRLELRFEAYNVFNHAQFFNPVGDINASNFGQVVQAHDPRLIQLGAKFYF